MAAPYPNPLAVSHFTSLLSEPFQDGIVAFAGGGQFYATPIYNEVNRITTAANIGDSVKLPASTPQQSLAGVGVFIINHGASSVQVFGGGNDTIDDVASAVGVSQMVGSMTLYMCTAPGQWYSNGIGTGYAGSFSTLSFTDAITAKAGGTRPLAVPITTTISKVSTVANAGDSVILPASSPGVVLQIINAAGANAMQVFAQGNDTIDGIAGATGYSQAAGKTVQYLCTAVGFWHKLVSA